MENIKVNQEWLSPEGMYRCPYCEKEYSKRGISTHIWRNHGSGINHDPNIGFLEKRVIWNKGKSKAENESLKKAGESYSNKLISGEITPSFSGKKHTKESKGLISKALSKNNHGGRCKWYTVLNPKGEEIKVQGTWELRFAKILNHLDENWIKPSLYHSEHSLTWTDGQKNEHTYTPDFWSPKFKKYFEVKGYWWGNDKQKMEIVYQQNPEVKIELIQKKQIEYYEALIK